MATDAPPPYSETDIYSNSGSGHAVPSPTSPHQDESARSRRFSDYAPSSAGESIYTPPYTPDGSVHHTGAIDPVQSELSSTAASAYFESRPPAHNPNGTMLEHSIIVSTATRHEDLPYPEPESAWLEKDVTKQDWATFINYLIPHHADVSNGTLAERKLKAELLDERMERLTLDADRVDPSHMDALLGQLRPVTAEAEKYMLGIGDVVAEWNEGFFGPRGVQIILSGEPFEANGEPFEETRELESEETMPMPGAWVDHPEEDNSVGPGGRAFGGFRGFGRGFRRGGFGPGGFGPGGFGQGGSGPGGFGRGGFGPGGFGRGRGGFANVSPGMSSNSSGFRMGGIVADDNGFRMGRMVADNNGFRIGNLLVADDNGFKLGRFVADGHGVRFSGGPTRPAPPAAHREYGDSHRDIPHGREDERRSRGRGPGRYPSGDSRHRRRSRSSSSSSSSSSESDQSVGSLPDYDNLKDTQLPVLKQSLEAWLAHPDQPVTKEAMRNVKEELKAAKARNVRPSDAEVAALKVNVRKLFRSFKDLKKSQKAIRKAAKAERRAIKKQEKHQRRALKREERRIRKGKGRADPPMPAMPSMPSMPLMPSMPSMPSIPSMPSAPSMPRSPGAFPTPLRPATLSREATEMRATAARMQSEARTREIAAEKIRGQIAHRRTDDKLRLQLQDTITQLEEQAEEMHREAVRLMAESLNMDKAPVADDGQESGVLHG